MILETDALGSTIYFQQVVDVGALGAGNVGTIFPAFAQRNDGTFRTVVLN